MLNLIQATLQLRKRSINDVRIAKGPKRYQGSQAWRIGRD